MIAHCPQCACWHDQPRDPRRPMTTFTLRGVQHTAPDMWLAGRAYALGMRHDQATFERALEQWAVGCTESASCAPA